MSPCINLLPKGPPRLRTALWCKEALTTNAKAQGKERERGREERGTAATNAFRSPQKERSMVIWLSRRAPALTDERKKREKGRPQT